MYWDDEAVSPFLTIFSTLFSFMNSFQLFLKIYLKSSTADLLYIGKD